MIGDVKVSREKMVHLTIAEEGEKGRIRLSLAENRDIL